jgi:predicted  nucleic acid-binding Zn-ribbon protein
MRRPWFVLGFLVTWTLSGSLWAQDSVSDGARQAQQQKAAYYTQVEYQRCRSDIVELLVKAEPLEKRIKELEDEVRKLTEELTTLRSASHEAKPAN